MEILKGKLALQIIMYLKERSISGFIEAAAAPHYQDELQLPTVLLAC